MTEKSNSVVDLEEALRFTAGDADMLRSVIVMFLEEGPRQVEAVRTCVAANDGPGIARAAHLLKGSITIFAAKQAVDAATALELAAADDLSTVPRAWELLQNELKRLFSELEKL